MKSSKKWCPTAQEMMSAQIAVLKDTINKKCDAIFMHAPPTTDRQMNDKLINLAANSHKNKLVKIIVLNSLSTSLCKQFNITDYGYKTWEKKLVQAGVEKNKILAIRPSFHTAAEAEQFFTLAKNKKWKRIIISSHPHHQLRCFLQAVATMRKINYWPKVYNLTHDGIPWKHYMEKQVLLSAPQNIKGDLSIHINKEYERIVTYAQKPPKDSHGKPKYTQHSTIPEMMLYLKKRD